MTYPNLADTYDDVALLAPATMLAHRRRSGALSIPPPAAVIFCYQASLAQYLARRYAVQKITAFMGDLFLLRSTHGRLALAANFGIGAPVVAVLSEEFAAWGVGCLLAVGLAGGLQPALQTGDVVLCDRALRDEGTSYHYLAPSRYCEATPSVVAGLARALAGRQVAHTVGASWTTDAPYRETRRAVRSYQGEGIMTVEMEAAALFSVGRYLKVQTGAAFVVADLLADARWQPAADDRAVQLSLRRLLDAVIAGWSQWSC